MSNENFNENDDPVEGTIPGIVRPKPSSNNGGILTDKVVNSNSVPNDDEGTIGEEHLNDEEGDNNEGGGALNEQPA